MVVKKQKTKRFIPNIKKRTIISKRKWFFRRSD